MLTKTDFISYLDCPMHLWASKNNRIEVETSLFDQHLMNQGREIEKLAREFLKVHLKGQGELEFERTFEDGNFQARVDALIYDPDQELFDIYEIKSSTSIKKEHQYDVAFQRLVVEKAVPVRDVYLVFVNGDYQHSGEMDLEGFFEVVNLNKEIEELREEVRVSRENAGQVVSQESPQEIEGCLKPGSCPCPALCHGDLPDYPIYNLPRLHWTKAVELRATGILSMTDIPEGFILSEKQTLHLEAVRGSAPLIDRAAIREELEGFEYPLYFLDYETYPPGVPFFPGYRPYQHIVFQYSLHVVDKNGDLKHHELLLTGTEDPGPELVPHLLERIGDYGTVLVWNKSFEMSKNRGMAELYPAYGEGLLAVNDRIFDLMEIFSRGLYIDPDFRGSASLKNVLPVMVPDLKTGYKDLPISGGDQAMLVWADIFSGRIPEEEVPGVREDLLAYCKLDTLAMVRIWEKLREL